MDRIAIFVDAGYLFAQGSVTLAGTKQARALLVLDPPAAIKELVDFAESKVAGCSLLRIYWYDGALGSRPTLEQEQIAHLDDLKLRLGFINSVGQQKGVDSLIVTDLIELARLGAIQHAVLLSGDEDVRVGVQIAQNYGVRVHLLGIKPSRGSQSKALLQESDTTSEWDERSVSKFLSIRSVPSTNAGSTAAIPVSGSKQATASQQKQVATPQEAARLEKAATEFADSLVSGDIKSLIAYWSSHSGVPPEFDGRLLAKSRNEIGRDLDQAEKKFLRVKFFDAVRAKAAGA